MTFSYSDQNFQKKLLKCWFQGQNLGFLCQNVGFQGQNVDFWLFRSTFSEKMLILRSKFRFCCQNVGFQGENVDFWLFRSTFSEKNVKMLVFKVKMLI